MASMVPFSAVEPREGNLKRAIPCGKASILPQLQAQRSQDDQNVNALPAGRFAPFPHMASGGVWWHVRTRVAPRTVHQSRSHVKVANMDFASDAHEALRNVRSQYSRESHAVMARRLNLQVSMEACHTLPLAFPPLARHLQPGMWHHGSYSMARRPAVQIHRRSTSRTARTISSGSVVTSYFESARSVPAARRPCSRMV